ncbi:MAG: nucleotidyltransferase domain-containing protein [Desulfamplus sp.]|nr:nucleotidyltransferase domain-containing protein [Desulfamplus sp.]
MRLKLFEQNIIVNAVKHEDPDAAIYLFGSRVDDEQLGGDIDIIVLSSIINFDGKLRIKKELFKSLEEQKIDLIIVDDPAEPFAFTALEKGIKLA